MSEPLAISVRRATELAPIGVTTIYKLMKEGKLKSTTVLGRRMIDYRSFMELLIPTSVPTNLSRAPGEWRRRTAKGGYGETPKNQGKPGAKRKVAKVREGELGGRLVRQFP